MDVHIPVHYVFPVRHKKVYRTSFFSQFRKLPQRTGNVNTPNRYTTGTSLGIIKGPITNHKKRGNNQFANDVWQSR